MKITGGAAIRGWCEAHSIDVMSHNPLEPVTTAATIYLTSSIPNLAQLEYQHRLAAAYPPELFLVMPALDGDYFALPTAPGFGVEFKPRAAADCAFECWEAPHRAGRKLHQLLTGSIVDRAHAHLTTTEAG